MRSSTYLKASALLALGLAFGPAPVRAADAPAKPAEKISANAGKARKRTIKDMIAMVMSEGGKDEIKPPLSTNLGFTEVPKVKLISYADEKSPDHRNHGFQVVLDAKGKPTDIVWINLAITKDEKGTLLDGWNFRTSPTGSLKTAVRSTGYVGEVNQDKQTIDSAIRKKFEAERDFVLRDCDGLPFDKE